MACAFQTTAHASATRMSLEAVRVLADSRNDQPSAADALQDGDRVQREDANPSEHKEQAEDTPEPERGKADHGRQHDVTEEQDELGNHEHNPVLGMPLDLGIVPLEEQRNEGEDPEIGEHDHDAAIR